MNITKLGHSCLLVEESNARILIDPGAYSEGHTKIDDVKVILFTHEHPDHTDPASLAEILKRNPEAEIWCNEGVGAVLTGAGINWGPITAGERRDVNGMSVEAYGKDHAIIHPTVPSVVNTSYIIQGLLCVTGDAFAVPPRPIEILALPVCAPWMRLAEAIDFALTVKPKKCFPVHDGFLKFGGQFHRLPGIVLEKNGIEFQIL